MHFEERTWLSPALGHDMSLKVYGHDGRPVVTFPSQEGRWWDFESWGMVDACAGFVESGRMGARGRPAGEVDPRRRRLLGP